MTATARPSGETYGPAAPAPGTPRRLLAVLVLSQTLGGAGMAAGITVGALLAEDVLGSTGLAGLPAALYTGGAAVGAAAIGRISQRRGRRPGLALGHGAAALGSAGVVAGAAAGWAALLLGALFVYGAGSVTALLARYAGADLAPPDRRGRAAGTVLLATTLGAVAGPSLVGPTGEFADACGLPRLTGPFLLAGVAFTAACLVLLLWLRPDPTTVARATAGERGSGQGDSPRTATAATAGDGAADPERARKPDGTELPVRTTPLAQPPASERWGRWPAGVVTGATVMITAQLVMVAVMTMTPVHMTGHGHSTQSAGFVIALHVGAMFLPSVLSGTLTDRVGRPPVALASGAVLLGAGLLAGLAPPHGIAPLAIALVLLGLGWNLALVSGTAMITDAAPPATAATLQGHVDTGMSLAGATGGIVSGLAVAGAGYPLLAIASGVLALAVIPLAALRGSGGR
ncbi:MFS transporter [Streptomyces sp. LP11]|uniref:MFS transporter n=1 Tax=Streptomyces pyxinicus TaxID=2970331 RepID=A0ABT2B4W6_9ACTN|nr:MFS transporter [Streptomyces sp. LP11]MCS0603564.1 MFS transporter [Streptomyces sp. LP11]